MLSAQLFDQLEYIARFIRKNDSPFGGIQVILSGDFFQLPPVDKGGQEKLFCFESNAWKIVVKMHIELQKVFRQSDAAFVSILNEIRLGRISANSLKQLQYCLKNNLENNEDGIQPTVLCIVFFRVLGWPFKILWNAW